MPQDRASLRRQADKVTEHLGYIKAHLANMADAYKGQAEEHYTAILATMAAVEMIEDMWSDIRGSL